MSDDRSGSPHLQATHEHWRVHGAKMREDQLSDGTLRLIGLLWMLLSGSGPLLLEEPELSLHEGVIRLLPQMFHRVMHRRSGGRRQIFVSTHSSAMLSDSGISPEEILLLRPTEEETEVKRASQYQILQALAKAGAPIGPAVIAETEPEHSQQLALFGD